MEEPKVGIAEGTARLNEPPTTPVSRKLVVIRCKASKRVAAAPVFDERDLRRAKTGMETYSVSSKNDLIAALNSLKDGDILVLNSHSNQNLFVYKDKDRGEVKVRWEDVWKHVGRKTPPRLAAVILAGCAVPKDTLSRKSLRAIRKALHTSIFVAPYATAKYEVDPIGVKDNITAKEIGLEIARFYAKQIDKGELTERLFGRQERFGVVYGCNGYNHPLGCACGFG
ncbi:MAG: hypothetical protein ABIN58_03190, partial [candidate division WOR-3 bacterium]